jgi:uncharacterized membrane-anchored protein
MNAKKFLISTLVMALIYLGVSYLFSLMFQQEFNWTIRLISAVFFGVVITAIQIYLAKKKRR